MSDMQPLRSFAVPRLTPLVLSFVAGYVDSCTYLALFGAFVAQVTGSFVFVGTQLVRSEPGALAKLLAIPIFFLAGLAVALLVHLLRNRPRAALASSLVGECLLLIGFLTVCLVGMPFPGPDAPGAIGALLFGMAAMGTQSAVVRLLMRDMASTNVMTTNTTLLAINVAPVLLGWIEGRKAGPGDHAYKAAQARRELGALLPIGLGFLAGTALGALAYITMGLPCLGFAIVPLGILALWYLRRS
jgi:uncharacterized membrane protein YoaK (UPF0700 family)